MLKTHRQISKNQCFGKHCLCDKDANFQLYRAHLNGVIWKKTDNWRQIRKQTSSTYYGSNDVFLKCVENKKILRRNSKGISLLEICRGSHLCEMTVYFMAVLKR